MLNELCVRPGEVTRVGYGTVKHGLAGETVREEQFIQFFFAVKVNVSIGFKHLKFVYESGSVFGEGDRVGDDDIPLFRGNAPEFGERCFDLREVMQCVAGDDTVEIGLPEWKKQAIVGYKVEIGNLVFPTDFVILFDGLAGNVDAGDVALREAFSHFKSQVSVSGAEIETAFTGLDIQQIH